MGTTTSCESAGGRTLMAVSSFENKIPPGPSTGSRMVLPSDHRPSGHSAIQDDEFSATVLGATFLGVVGGDWLFIAPSVGRDTRRINTTLNEQSLDRVRPIEGKLLVSGGI